MTSKPKAYFEITESAETTRASYATDEVALFLVLVSERRGFLTQNRRENILVLSHFDFL